MRCRWCNHDWTDDDRRNNKDLECPTCGAFTITSLPGPQENFLKSKAYFTLFGGGAGGSKTFSLLLKAAMHISQKDFTAVFFRRTGPEIMTSGGLWDSASALYSPLGMVGRASPGTRDWVLAATGARISFAGLQHERDKVKKKGAQIAGLYFDELDSFTEEQFTYMLSRNRPFGTCEVLPHCCASVNPNADSWIRDWISPWVVPDHPMYGTVKYGELLWFRRFEGPVPTSIKPYVIHRNLMGSRGSSMVWVTEDCPFAKSITYIPSSLAENPFIDPNYEANLLSLSKVERERLLGYHPHCWLVRASAGNVLNANWFLRMEAGEELPTFSKRVRSWDFAASAGRGDWTVGLLLGITPTGHYVVLDIVRGQWSAADVEQKVRETALRDGEGVPIIIEEEKGAAGQNLIAAYRRLLRGWSVTASKITGDKVVRARKASARTEQRKVSVVFADWAETFVQECDSFPQGSHDDMVDAFAAAVNFLNHRPTVQRYGTLRG